MANPTPLATGDRQRRAELAARTELRRHRIALGSRDAVAPQLGVSAFQLAPPRGVSRARGERGGRPLFFSLPGLSGHLLGRSETAVSVGRKRKGAAMSLKTEQFTSNLRCPITNEEALERLDQAARLTTTIKELEQTAKAEAAARKSQAASLIAQHDQLEKEASQRAVFRDVDCERVFDYSLGIVFERRLDTLEVTGKPRDLTYSEKQLGLDLGNDADVVPPSGGSETTTEPSDAVADTSDTEPPPAGDLDPLEQLVAELEENPGPESESEPPAYDPNSEFGFERKLAERAANGEASSKRKAKTSSKKGKKGGKR